MLCTNTALSSLHFHNCGMNIQMTSALSKALQVKCSLTELILYKVEERIGAVLNSLATSPSTLCTLSLRECHISNADEPSLTALLTRNTLKSLDLPWSRGCYKLVLYTEGQFQPGDIRSVLQ